jgi:1-aminocyclopropane-1-carboxylate deaminase
MNFDLKIETNNQQIFLPMLEEKKVTLFLKREDSYSSFCFRE